MSKKEVKKKSLSKLDKLKKVFYIIEKEGTFDSHVVIKSSQNNYGSLQSSLMRLCYWVGCTEEEVKNDTSGALYSTRILELLKSVYKKFDRDIQLNNPKSLINAYLNDDRLYKSGEHINVLEELLESIKN